MRYPKRRSDDIKRLVLAALSAVVIAVPATAGTTPPTTPAAACPSGLFKITDYRWYASRVYRRDKVSAVAHRRMARMLRCQHSAKARALVERYHQRYKRQRAARALAARRAARLPFVGGGRRWAIPWPIVRCESGGSWSAHNPTSPARGPYQLLGHGEPWPASTPRARRAHHRIAAALYRRGGTGPWLASKHCWG